MVTLVKYSLAASILAAVGAATWLGLVDANDSVYGAVAERLGRINSLVYRVQWIDDAELVNIVEGDGSRVMYVAPSHYRFEMPNGALHIIDAEADQAIYLNPATKEALVMSGQVANSMASMSAVPLVDMLRQHFRIGRELTEGIEKLGEKEIGGIQATGLRSTIHGEIVEIWIDPDTSLPVEVRVRLVIPSYTPGSADRPIHMWRVMSSFEYDIAVDRSLMSVDVPAGYRAIQMPDLAVVENATAASLTDLIALLRMCAEHNDSKFPASLSMTGASGSCMGIMKRSISAYEQAWESGTDAEKQTAMEAIVEFGTAMGRASAFLYSLEMKHDLRYFGDGMKLGMADRPLLWYSPEGDSHYQIVYADLSVKQLPASALPKVPTPPEPAVKQRREIRSTSPRVVLPRIAVKDFETLRGIRESGKQSEVRFIELWLMPEFMESGTLAELKQRADPEASRFDFLGEFGNLEGLRVDHLYLTENDLKFIGQCTNLEKLSLSGIQVLETPPGKHRLRGAELRHLSKLSGLEVLDLSQSQFAGGLQHLSGLSKLHTLILSSFEHLNDASVAQLKELPHLQTLVLAPVYADNPERTVTSAGLASLRELPSLKTLYVGFHDEWTMPIEALRSLLPDVNVQPGFEVGSSDDPGVFLLRPSAVLER